MIFRNKSQRNKHVDIPADIWYMYVIRNTITTETKKDTQFSYGSRTKSTINQSNNVDGQIWKDTVTVRFIPGSNEVYPQVFL